MKIERDLYGITKRAMHAPNAADLSALSDIANSLDPARYLESLGFELFDWQKAVLQDPAKRIIINGCRQAGKSTIMSGLVCHRAKFFPKSTSIILAPSKDQASLDMRKIIDFIGMDDTYPARKHETTEEIELANGSWIKVVTATDKSARGYSKPDIVLFDEASRIEESVFNAVKPMITGHKVARMVEISTPYGKMGFFWKHWNSKSWRKYLVTSPYDAREESGEYHVFRRKVSREILPTYCLRENQQCELYESPRHQDEEEQALNLEDMDYLLYRQEFLCEFVDNADQVFQQTMVERMFHKDIVDASEFDLGVDLDSLDMFKQENMVDLPKEILNL